VQAAIVEGRLDAERLESQRKLQREQAFLLRKVDPQARQHEKERVKVLHRGVKQKYDRRRKDGGKE
jgi:ribosome biogenesis GTPase